MSRTQGQKRAEYCLEKLSGLTCSREDFKSFSAGLPSLILQNGFGQALAFLLAKGGGKHSEAFTIITGWLVKQKLLRETQPSEMLLQISRMEQTHFLQAQKETLAMLEWLKRYANADLFGG